VDINIGKGRLQGEGRSRLESSAVLVLCLNLGKTYTCHCRIKSKRTLKWLDFLVDVLSWFTMGLTLNQRVRGVFWMLGLN
jgi:hypothetical protein